MRNELYDIIEQRKAIRKYNMAPLDGGMLQDIRNFGDEAKPLIPGIRIKFNYFRNDEVKSMMAIKAPHYVGIYSENKDGYLLNAGYMLQQMDLFLSEHNLGSCWLGMAKPAVNLPETMDGLSFVIMLASQRKRFTERAKVNLTGKNSQKSVTLQVMKRFWNRYVWHLLL